MVVSELRSGFHALLMMLVLAPLAGCLGGGAGEEASASDASPDAEDGANATLPAPVAVIDVEIDGNETSPVNGTISTVVGTNVTFSAEQSSDSNDSFAWDLGDGSTANGSSVVHAFADPGDFNVTLTVSRANMTDTASIRVNVTSAIIQGQVVWTDVHDASGTLLVGNINAPTLAGVDYRDHPVTVADVDPNGTAVTAATVRIALTAGGGAVDMILYWRSPDGTVLASSPANIGGGHDHTIEYAEPMPPGEYVVRVRLWTGAQASYDVHTELDYGAA